MRIAQLVVAPARRRSSSSRWTSCRRASAACAASAPRRAADGRRAAHPRLGDPALERPDPALPPREGRQGVLAPPGRRRQLGREPRRRARTASSRRRSASTTRSPSRGRSRSSTRSRPCAAPPRSTSSTSSSPATWGPLARGGDLEGRGRSRAPAVRVGELDEIVLHPPIQRFLARWRPVTPWCTSGRSGRPRASERAPGGAFGAVPAQTRAISPLGSKAAGGQRWPTRTRVY